MLSYQYYRLLYCTRSVLYVERIYLWRVVFAEIQAKASYSDIVQSFFCIIYWFFTKIVEMIVSETHDIKSSKPEKFKKLKSFILTSSERRRQKWNSAVTWGACRKMRIITGKETRWEMSSKNKTKKIMGQTTYVKPLLQCSSFKGFQTTVHNRQLGIKAIKKYSQITM